MCKRLKVFPKYINLKCSNKSNSAKSALFKAKVVLLNNEIKHNYKIRDNLSAHLKVIHSELAFRLHPIELDVVREKCYERARLLSFQQYTKQNSKLATLRRQKSLAGRTPADQNDQIRFHPRLTNLTNVNLTPRESELLEHGLNYAPALEIKQRDILSLAAHVDAALDENDMYVKLECARVIEVGKASLNVNSNNPDIKTIDSLKKKLKNENLILCKADKGNTISILSKNDYITKMSECLNSMEIEELKSDPTEKYNRQIISAVNNSNLIFNANDKLKLKNSHPSAPILYGLPKLHKPNIPLRPVSSAYNSPSQGLCKELSRIVPGIINFKPLYSIKNSTELINKIKDLEIPHNAKLVSFDVCSLFPSIPTDELKRILNQRIELEVTDPFKSSQLINLVNLCIDQNYFAFNGKFYKQNNGLAMGSAFSPFCAEFYMNNFENNMFSSSDHLINHIFLWQRYVDDIFCIWTGTERQLNLFLNNFLNKIDDKIKFTLELGNKELNFLDLTIKITYDQKLEFDIFRKETYSDAVIPSHSCHPWNTKMSAFHSLIERLLKVPLNNENFKKELNTIKTIAINNGYNTKIVYQILNKKQKKSVLESIFPPQRQEKDIKQDWRRVPYIHKFTEKLTIPLKKKNLKPAFFNKNTLKNFLSNNKIHTKRDKLEKSGVYQISCGDCPGIYIGKTKRSLKIRLNEHINSVKTDKPTSGLSKHLKLTGHGCNINDIKLLHSLNGGHVLDKYEIFEIRKANDDGYTLLNDQIDFNNRSPLLDPKLIS